MEEKILEQFKKKMGKEIATLDLDISIDEEGFEEDLECIVMERQDDGRVWNVELYKNGKIKCINEM